MKKAVEDYIDYYNTKRYQKRLKCMSPMEYRNHSLGILG
ncbi:IS3 family transposase [Caldicellulosiruptor sp. DIB 104C]|nr:MULTISPECIES: IS3 family transposase [unclassified Caldicellulosiruptor]